MIFLVSGERKRDAAAPSMPVIPSKKAKLEGSVASKVDDSWEQTAIDCDPSDLVASIGRAMENDDRTKARNLFCGGLKLVRKGKSDKILWLALMLVAKQWPNVRRSLLNNQTIKVQLNNSGPLLKNTIFTACCCRSRCFVQLAAGQSKEPAGDCACCLRANESSAGSAPLARTSSLGLC
jgi:hypothetical protein